MEPRPALPVEALLGAWLLLTLILLIHLGAHPMTRKILTVAAVAVAALMMSGCVTSQLVKDLSPEAKEKLAMKFIERCGGTVNISAGGASGQMGGAVHGEFNITGTCPTPQLPTPADMKALANGEPLR